MADIFLVLGATVAAFLLGSLPFAVWLGKLVARSDVRDVGDGNPGTANAFKAGGWKTGVPTLILEVGKAGLPVGLATASFGPQHWALAPVALAPIFGHAFSPFLRMRGGKAIAASFGSWMGLTGFLCPLVLGLAMGICFAVQAVHAWAVVGGTVLFGVFLIVVGSPAVILLIWAINSGLLAWTHRRELSLEFVPRAWLPLRRTKDRRT